MACHWKEVTACYWKEWDLEDETTSVQWVMVVQLDWAHGVRIHQPHDAVLCVCYVHLCCESVGDSMGMQWLVVETPGQEHAGERCEFEVSGG